jgi:site-specific recombinase XerD
MNDPTTPIPPAWRTALEPYAAHLHARGTSTSTATTYRRRLETASRHLPADPWAVRPDDLARYLHDPAHAWTGGTRLRYRSALRAFYAWALDQAYVDQDPSAALSSPEPDPSHSPAWDEALSGFQTHLHARSLALSTIDSYVRDLEWLRDAMPAADPTNLPTRDLAAWLAGRDWSRRTHLRVLVSLRAFYAWAVETDRCQRSPLVGLQSIIMKRSGPGRRQPAPRWLDPLDAFARHLEAGGRATSTVEHYRQRLIYVSHTFADPWAVTTADLADYLSRPDWKPNTKRMHRVALQRFYAWALKSGHTTIDPAVELDPVLIPRALPRPAPDDALSAALEVADDRARLAIELAALAGLRLHEIARLRWDQVTPSALLVQGKGGHWRQVPLHPDLAAHLIAYRRRTHESTTAPTEFVFPSPRGGHLTPPHLGKIITRCVPAGAFSTHALRHRFASQAYAATLDLRAVQELLGHTRPETTAIYAALPDGHLAAAVAGARLGLRPTAATLTHA